MSANAEKSAQLVSTMITVVILSSLAGVGGTWAYENRENLRDNSEELIYRLRRPHLWSEPLDKKTRGNDPGWKLPTYDITREINYKPIPTIDPGKMIIPRVEINVPRYVPYNPPQIYIPQQPGGFR
jgi:hypothetical protein